MALKDKSVELSEQVVEEIKEGQEAAIEAVRSFTETVDKTLAKDGSPTQAEEIVDSALKMADKLVETQYTFLKKVVHSAGESLGVERVQREEVRPHPRNLDRFLGLTGGSRESRPATAVPGNDPLLGARGQTGCQSSMSTKWKQRSASDRRGVPRQGRCRQHGSSTGRPGGCDDDAGDAAEENCA